MTILDADKDPEGSGDSHSEQQATPLNSLYNPANSKYIQKKAGDQSEVSIRFRWSVYSQPEAGERRPEGWKLAKEDLLLCQQELLFSLEL